MLKKVWEILLREIGIVTATVIVIVPVAVLIVYFNKYPPMASAFATLATILLASAAFIAILNSNRQNRRLNMESILKEIFEWAVDIAKCESQAKFWVGKRKTMLIDLLFKYQAINAKTEYMKFAASSFKKGNLQTSVNKTARKLGEHIEILKKQIEGKTTAEVRDEHFQSLHKSSVALTKEAAEIRTKGIG